MDIPIRGMYFEDFETGLEVIMRQRGISTMGGILLAGLLGTLTAVAVTDWMVVDVQVADPEGSFVRLQEVAASQVEVVEILPVNPEP